MTKYRTAIYCRKSSEDDESIQLQERIVRDYVKGKKELDLYKVYSDNGHTGVNFNRPAWKEMLQDVDYGIVKCIVVKDLSRLGRNFTGVGEYLERTFPAKGVRVIAISDNYDSLNANGMELDASIMNLVNSYMAAETSFKVHVILDRKMKKGTVISKVPYGYIKSDKSMVIDPPRAAVVRKIYNWFIDGVFISDIARKLQEEGIPSPSGAEYWNAKSISRILKDRTYIGEYRTGTRRREMRKEVEVKDEDVHVFLNHHEAIVSETDFGIVQYAFELRPNNWKNSIAAQTDPDQLKGLAKCAICGKALVYLRKNEATRVKTSKYYCKYHTGAYPEFLKLTNRPEITAERLKEEVTRLYNEYVERVARDTGSEAVRARRRMEKDLRDEIEFAEQLIDKYSKELVGFYERYVAEEISKEEFDVKADKNRKKRQDARKLLEKYKAQLSDLEISNARMKSVVTIDEKIDSFDETVIRKVVTEVLLGADGNVELRFKHQEAIEEVEKYTMTGVHSQKEE